MALARTKAPKVTRATVSVYGSVERGSHYNHGRILFYVGESDSSWLEIRFQRHSLSIRDPLMGPDSRGWGKLPNPQFDFGHAWSSFYAPRVETQFACDYNGPHHMQLAAKFIARVTAAIQEYNLGYISECDLTQWIAALERLKIRVETRRSTMGVTDLNVRELPEDQQWPARKLIQAKTETASQDA